MKPFATAFILLILVCLFAVHPLQARQAAELFPSQQEAVFESTWRAIVTDVEENVVSDSLFTSAETVGFEGDLANEVLTYTISPYPPLAQRLIRAEGNRVFAALSDLIDLGALDAFGFPIDFDADVDIINLDVAPGTSLNLGSETFRVALPQEIIDLIDLPAGITVRDSVDIAVQLNYDRLLPRDFDNLLGTFTAEGGKIALSVDVTITLVVPIFGPQPLTIPILSSFGPSFYMAENYGLVYEELPPTRVAIVFSFPPLIDVNQPLADIDGFVYEKESLTPVPGTHVPDTSVNEIAGLIALQPNYPNPFNPVTTLVFELAESAAVRIEVFDMQGRKVAEAANGSFGSGTHHLPFDASTLASGVYSYRVMATGNQSGTPTAAFGRFTVLK